MMLKIWLYAYALGLSSSHRIEQLIREDLGFRFLAGNNKPDYWTLNDFRRRYPRALNDVFTRVVEGALELGMVKLGRRRSRSSGPWRRSLTTPPGSDARGFS